MNITISEEKNLTTAQITQLYKANKWNVYKKPEQLRKGLLNSHSLVTAWEDDKLVGLGSAISDGTLVVYFSHLLVLPEYQKKGIGQMIANRLLNIYDGFHMQILTSGNETIEFYIKNGFEVAKETTPMWIYDGL